MELAQQRALLARHHSSDQAPTVVDMGVMAFGAPTSSRPWNGLQVEAGAPVTQTLSGELSKRTHSSPLMCSRAGAVSAGRPFGSKSLRDKLLHRTLA